MKYKRGIFPNFFQYFARTIWKAKAPTQVIHNIWFQSLQSSGSHQVEHIPNDARSQYLDI